jgi:hypothetical protein
MTTGRINQGIVDSRRETSNESSSLLIRAIGRTRHTPRACRVAASQSQFRNTTHNTIACAPPAPHARENYTRAATRPHRSKQSTISSPVTGVRRSPLREARHHRECLTLAIHSLARPPVGEWSISPSLGPLDRPSLKDPAIECLTLAIHSLARPPSENGRSHPALGFPRSSLREDLAIECLTLAIHSLAKPPRSMDDLTQHWGFRDRPSEKISPSNVLHAKYTSRATDTKARVCNVVTHKPNAQAFRQAPTPPDPKAGGAAAAEDLATRTRKRASLLRSISWSPCRNTPRSTWVTKRSVLGFVNICTLYIIHEPTRARKQPIRTTIAI